MTQSPASLFISILDLIILSHIPEYAVKKELFLDLYRGLCVHNPSISFPSLPEGYFASLPSTRSDDATIHMLLNKKQMNLSPLEGIPKDIAVTIVNSLTNRKAGAKSVYVASVPVDYCAYGSFGSMTSRMQLQQQFLAEREVTTYLLHPSAAQRQINSNIYGHHQQIVKDLQSTVFKQFWELLPESDKHGILTMEFKDILCQARESVYWFVIRYVLLNWNSLIPAVTSWNVIREGSLFYIDVSKINQETLSAIIEAASAYDTAVDPPSSSGSSALFCEDIRYESSSFDETLSSCCLERFRLFFCWLLCDRMDFAFQMHQKEEEADRVAASLLSEDISTNENGKKKKKKKRSKKKEVENPPPSLKEVKSGTDQTPAKQVSIKVNSTQPSVDQGASKTINPISPEKAEDQPKPIPSEPLQSQPPSTDTPVMKKRVIRPDIQRINRFLLGERREKPELPPLPERKRAREIHETRPFVSLRQVLARPDPWALNDNESVRSPPLVENSPILPPEGAVITMILNQTSPIDSEVIEPSQGDETSSTVMSIKGYDGPEEYSAPPSQLLQQTLQQSIPEPTNW